MKPGDKVVARETTRRAGEAVGIEKGEQYTVRTTALVDAIDSAFDEVWLEEVPNWYYRRRFDVVAEKRKLFVLEMKGRSSCRLPHHTMKDALAEAKVNAKEGFVVTILEAVKVVEPGEPNIREA